ncbi:hypothetical protein [Mangrovibacterium diazotrophicum]|uniref:Uncharacterized protein n=1 Tax=Mangrovibacterium diazotrophicum TaxID=1261403 RepID=A0A419W2J2_9BACT|nr:hypothetical protein [Mangrovibacterium diazotrophicum]RKD89705.1 hypothetical protein BC643_0036 [Mangrovibacterium diazotrophicum]
MTKKLRLIFGFYRSFAFPSLLITMACVAIIYANGLSAITALFWFKIATLGVTVYFVNIYKRHEFYYYKNLGLPRLQLWIPTLIFDFSLFLTLTILTGKFYGASVGS